MDTDDERGALTRRLKRPVAFVPAYRHRALGLLKRTLTLAVEERFRLIFLSSIFLSALKRSAKEADRKMEDRKMKLRDAAQLSLSGFISSPS